MSALLSAPPESRCMPAPAVDAPTAGAVPTGDFVSIRGVRLLLAELVDRQFFTPEKQDCLRAHLRDAKPFPHLVLDHLFHPALLELVAEEFEDPTGTRWTDMKTRYESTRRTVVGAALGPATQLYFDIVHSGWFTEWVSAIIGMPYLLPDPKLYGGGLHESRTGATFAVHRDFARHAHIGLKNEMVFITYLNKGWDPDWGSALELWDHQREHCVTTVQPEFGRTILLPHGPVSYHGHTRPLKAPDDRPRRSVAAYYYSSPVANHQPGLDAISVFMRIHRVDRVKAMARMLMPPVLWSAARRLVRRR